MAVGNGRLCLPATLGVRGLSHLPDVATDYVIEAEGQFMRILRCFVSGFAVIAVLPALA